MSAWPRFFVGNAHLGEPEVEVHTERASEIVPGSAVWDSRGRRFHLVDACPQVPSGRPALKYSDGTIETYGEYDCLQVANSPCAADAFNAFKAGERVA